MSKNKFIAVLSVIGGVVLITALFFVGKHLALSHAGSMEVPSQTFIAQNSNDEDNDDNNIGEQQRSYSESTDTIANNELGNDYMQHDGNESSNTDYSSLLDENGIYVPQQSGTSGEISARARRLESMDQENMKTRAKDMVFKLRNFDSSALKQNWEAQFNSIMDAARAQQFKDKNILYQETQPNWARACSSYAEYRNKTRSIDFTSIYMDQIGTEEVPVVSFNVIEESNADYPMNGSEHWKPVNVVKSTYLVYFSPDGNFIYSVKSIEKNILEKNIYAYPFDEANSYGD